MSTTSPLPPGALTAPAVARNREPIPPPGKPMVGMHPLERMGTPEDVANAAAFLACEEAA